MAENDQKDKTVEKVTGEVENTDKKENNEDRYEKVCFICHRPESVTGKMIDLPNNICVCPDCMQKSFDAMNNMNFGGMDYSQFMNMGPMMGFGDMDAQIPKSQRVKKKKPEEEKEPILNIKDIPAPHKIKAKLDEYVVGQEYAKKVMSVAVYNHYKRVATDTMDEIEIEKSNMLMIGPTGSGKTYLVKTLAKLLDVPLAIADATSLTEAGYIGDDIESVLSKLLTAADNDVEKAERGIVFIDEIDKICKRGGNTSGPDVSREGVQRDLLPLVEGCTVSTKHGMVKTDHILFIASGAFQVASPSDLIPELQGRLPIRVELKALTTHDFERILTEPNASITVQYKALMATEGVNIEFTEDGIKRIAQAAWQVNETTENIGARRLHTVLERLVEDISYDASEMNGQTVTIDAEYVSKHLDVLVADEDLSRFIL